MSLVATKDYSSDPAQMLADYRARKLRMEALAAQFIASQRPKKLKLTPPAPPPEPEPSAREVALRDWLSLAPAKALRRATSVIVLNTVCDRMGFSRVELIGECRTGDVVKARQIACWLMRKHSGISYPRIGGILGGRDHTTILHSCRKVDARKEADPDFAALLETMSAEIDARAA